MTTPQGPEPRTTGPSHVPDAPPAHVMVVEDDPTVADLLRDVFAGEPWEMRFVDNGEDAMRLVDERCPDLILTDITLPGASGIEVMKYARRVDPDVAIVLMTGQGSEQTAATAVEHGANDYLIKPFADIFTLAERLHRQLRNRNLKFENLRLLAQLQKQNEVLQHHEQELRERVEQATGNLDALYRVSMEIGADLELQPRLQKITAIAARLVASRGAVLYLPSEGGREFRAVYMVGGDAAFVEDGPPHFVRGEGWLGRAAEGTDPVVVGMPGGARITLPGFTVPFASEVLAVPMQQQRECVGVLVVFDRLDGFTGDHAELLRMYAAQAGVQVRNSQLYQRTKLLDRLKSEFVAVVSHEIRTPITSVKGAVELLSDTRYFHNTEQQTKLLGIAQANAERLLLLINDILDFSKLESASLTMNVERQRLEPVVQQAVQALRVQIEERRIRLALSLPEDLPDTMIDANRVTQVVTNLLSNAVKFSPVGGEVRVEALATDDGLRVLVRDRGEGIRAEDLPKLFRKFQQIDSRSTRKFGGTGLGLVISKGIVEQHGGTIGVDSMPGEGSTFWFTLPIARPHEHEERDAA